MADKTILIVEDHALSMKLLNDLLCAQGHRTILARDGMDAVTLATDHRPDLILMDIQLRTMSGLDALRWLKDDEGTRNIPVIAVTAFAQKSDEERFRRAGFDDYIPKPISVTGLLSRLQDRFGEAKSAA